jgi:diguanylate cyclase (GGDEF)-like protein
MKDWTKRSQAALSHAMKSGSMLLDSQLTIRWLSANVAEVAGFDDDELLGTSVLNVLHPDDLPLVAQIMTSEQSVPRSGLASHGHRYELAVRVGDETRGWQTVMVHGVNLLHDPDIEGFLVQISVPNQERQTMLAFHAAAAGAPLEEVLGHLVRTVVSGSLDEPLVIVCDPTGVCLAKTPNSALAVGEHRSTATWEAQLAEAGAAFSVAIRNQRTEALLGWFEIGPKLDFVHPFDLGNTAAVAISAGLLIERSIAERELVTLVESDALTGVANRRSFGSFVKQAERSPAMISVAYLDIDEFKLVNDTAGHSVGDQVLQAVASRLKKGLREDDVVARLGGDEFAVICVRAHPSSSELADRIRAYVNGPAVIDGLLIEISCSVGVASGPGTEASSLLRQADTAMFAVKRARKQSVLRLVSQSSA